VCKYYIFAIFDLGVAAGGSGVPFHFHGPGFAETLHGRKRWFLYAPENRPKFDPEKSTLRWLVEDYAELKNDELMLECILEPFDIIYFPDRWWHATLNIDNAVFISTFISAEFY
jgi:ribosomal protein L16 Arg81 hydroxylase